MTDDRVPSLSPPRVVTRMSSDTPIATWILPFSE